MTLQSHRTSRDLEVARLAFDEKLDVKTIAAQVRLTPERVRQILAGASRRDVVLGFLVSTADDNGHMPWTTKEIAVRTGVDINAVHFVLDGLRKKGYVSFDETRDPKNNHHVLSNIKVALKAPIWKTVDTGAPEVLAEVEPASDAATFGQEEEGPMTPTPGQVVELPVLESVPSFPALDGYPTISALVMRDDRVAQAVNLLELAGQDALAELVAGGVPPLTPFETEVIAFVRHCQEVVRRG